MTRPVCTCPDDPAFEHYHHDECAAFTSCGGWTWDPPCGGCDYCLAMQDEYYRSLALEARREESR